MSFLFLFEIWKHFEFKNVHEKFFNENGENLYCRPIRGDYRSLIKLVLVKNEKINTSIVMQNPERTHYISRPLNNQCESV